MLRFRGLFIFIAVLIAASSARAEWLTDVDEAIARARAERKFVLLYLRNGWCTTACNSSSDGRLQQRDSNPTINQLYNDAYVRVRANAILDSEDLDQRCQYPTGEGKVCGVPKKWHPPQDRVGQETPLVHPFVKSTLRRIVDSMESDPPSFVILDGAGGIFATFGANENASVFTGLLSHIRSERERVAKSVDLRLAGKVAEADLQLGLALVGIDTPTAAKPVLERAADAFHKAKDAEREQIANIWIGYANFLTDNPPTIGETMVRRQLFLAKSKTVEAEAWLAIGAINRQKRDARSALSAYRKAYAVAPARSEQAAAARAYLETMDDRPIVPKEPTSSANVRLIAPSRSTLLGPTDFVAEADGAVARVDFYLDEVRVSSSTRPFRARINLGNAARARTVKAVALSASLDPMGESVVTINDRSDSFRMYIVSPTGDTVSGRTVVEADAKPPLGQKVKRVDLYWGEKKVATLTAPPYRHELEVPNEFGYFRAVGTLDDGTTAEATRIFNAIGGTDSVEVQAVTLIVTAVDEKGERITGLRTSDFLVKEQGRPISAQIWESDDQPATIGLAIDASASMMDVYLDLVDIAETFLTIAAERGDRLFLVAFSNVPKLLHPPTKDIEALRKVLRATEAGGSTALYDGIAFGLQQLQDVRGRKALVVITDGQEVRSFTHGDSTHRLAHEVGAPIYPIVPWPGFRRDVSYGVPALQRLSDDTGGLTFVSPPRVQRAQIFARIREEVRGQYILSFLPPKGIRAGTWRDLEVTLPARPEIKLRTVKGYYAR